MEGFGNELFIVRTGEVENEKDGGEGSEKKKSISRSTVDLAYKHARSLDITGPKKLGVPGADSYLFPLFVRFGVI